MTTRHRVASIGIGIAMAAASVLALPDSAHAATACADGIWKAEYFANTTFKGTAKKTTCDSAVNENFKGGDPAGVTLPSDNFGVRWTTKRNFGGGGPFALSASYQDGIRIYLDGKIKYSAWANLSTTRKKTLDLAIPQGVHTLRIDFGAFTGNANVAFTRSGAGAWTSCNAPRTSSTPSPSTSKPLACTAESAQP